MALSLDEIRKKFKEKNNYANNPQNNQRSDKVSYPFWEMKEGEEVKIRFIPDADQNNDFFWRERQIVKLPFPGIKSKNNGPIEVQVPCIKAWDSKAICPIKSTTDPLWKNPQTEDIARIYKIHRTYVYQGFVFSGSPSIPDDEPSTKIRKFLINKQIHKIIEQSFEDTEMEHIPTDFVNGYDFRIFKTSSGGKYSTYTTSKFSTKSRPLTADELSSINENNGGYRLIESLGTKPDDHTLSIIEALFRDSYDGREYDEEAFGKYFKPYGLKNTNEPIVANSGSKVTQNPMPVSSNFEINNATNSDSDSDSGSNQDRVKELLAHLKASK